MSKVERRLEELGLNLPDPPKPAGSYVPFVRSGNLLFVSGQVPFRPDGSIVTGIVGGDVSVEDAQAAARLAGLSVVAVVRSAVASLDEVVRVVRLGGFVASAAGFAQQPLVINGCSDLMLEIFGDKGRHARAAVGVSSLPLHACVEIEATLELS
jgi:enamine deaminase RidA (YjgF/YER057c/UK114 family)